MLSTRFIEEYLAQTPLHLQEIILELRNLVASVAPDSAETIHWGCLDYYDERRGGPVSAGICQIGVREDHVELGFIHGAFLPDPKGLLEGGRKAKRFVRLHSYEDAPWDDLKELIAASARFDPRTLSFSPD